MKEKTHAIITLKNDKLVAKLLTPEDEQPSADVLHTYLPLGANLVRIAFCDMPPALAFQLSTSRIVETLAAIAEASKAVAQPGERWYTLVVRLHVRVVMKRDKLANELSAAIERQQLGWLNPVVLTGENSEYIFDLALNNEQLGRAAIAKIMDRYVVKQWELAVKQE